MSGLFLSTMAMMGLTFIIGFVVAGVIRMIAFWAERLEFYNTHKEELQRARNIRAIYQRRKGGWGFFSPLRKGDTDYELGSYYQGDYIMPEDVAEKGKFYHETSPGASDLGLMDFYYPSDTRIRILEQQAAEVAGRGAAETKGAATVVKQPASAQKPRGADAGSKPVAAGQKPAGRGAEEGAPSPKPGTAGQKPVAGGSQQSDAERVQGGKKS